MSCSRCGHGIGWHATDGDARCQHRHCTCAHFVPTGGDPADALETWGA